MEVMGPNHEKQSKSTQKYVDMGVHILLAILCTLTYSVIFNVVYKITTSDSRKV